MKTVYPLNFSQAVPTPTIIYNRTTYPKRGKIFFESWNFYGLEFRTGIIFSEANWDRNLVFFFASWGRSGWKIVVGRMGEFARVTNVYGILV
jgi:hypothetical protein